MIEFARFFFLAILVYAPWAFGCNRLWTINLLNDFLWGCAAFHVIGWLWQRRRPVVPLIPLLTWLVLLTGSFWMWYNARSFYDDSFFTYIYLLNPFPDLPGTWDKSATLFTLQEISGLACAFLVASDMMADRLWRERIWFTLGLTGASIIILGLVQKALHAPSILWLPEDDKERTFFATYFYHGNAGSYLNLTWPVLAAMMMKAWRDKGKYVSRALWMGAVLLGLSACIINVSRGTAAITLFLLLPALFFFTPYLRERFASMSNKTGWIIVLLFVAFFAALILGGALLQQEQRADMLPRQWTVNNPRYIAYQIDLKIIPGTGWFGYGPGAFAAIFVDTTIQMNSTLTGRWLYAHNDYLQTVIEYGYAGTALWSLLFFGGWVRAIRGSFTSDLRTHDRIEYRSVVLALTGVAINSLFDFPLQIYSLQLIAMVMLAFAWSRMTPVVRKKTKAEKEIPA